MNDDINTFIILDTETTGLSTKTDEVIEIAAIKIINNEVVDEFHSYVKPSIPVSSGARKINQISDDILKEAPHIKVVLSDFFIFIGDGILISHSTNDFDIKIINRQAWEHTQSQLENNHINSCKWIHTNFPDYESCALGKLCDFLDIEFTDRHRALDDCYAVYNLLNKLTDYNINSLSCSFDVIDDDPKSDDKYITDKDDNIVFKELSIKEARETFHKKYDSPFISNKSFVITGHFYNLSRTYVMEQILTFGGDVKSMVSKKTDYLISGVQYNKYINTNLENFKSSKLIAAEAFVDEGCPIKIISFIDFIKMKQDTINILEASGIEYKVC